MHASLPETPCKNSCDGCKCAAQGKGNDSGQLVLVSSESSKEKTSMQVSSNPSPFLAPEEQVLPTLRRDGSRNWLSPSMAKGYFWHRRRWVAYALIAFFVTLPHLRIGGKPYVLLDIASREFTFVGHTFYPTDSPLLACLILMAFFSIMLVTAVAGRVWCGWGCPQTVYLEFLFRPIDRFFAGTLGKGGTPKKPLSEVAYVAKLLVYLAACMFLAHTFLSYFVGTDKLAAWIFSSPTRHPVAFLVMGAATLGLLFNFLYFREQFCMIACPYGRFQSVMLDRNSYIVSYIPSRGEPRQKGKRESTLLLGQVGDCIDCGRCTAVCPTGIDIRDGLQMECIHCAQCVDACDDVMTKIGKPTGLIRYSSQESIAGNESRRLRARTVIYPTLIAIAASLFLVGLSTKFAFDAVVLRASGAPFTQFADKHVQNNFKVRLVNRSQTEQDYQIETADPEITADWSNGGAIHLAPGESLLAPLDLKFPMHRTAGIGSFETKLLIADSNGAKRQLIIHLHGPQ